MLLNVLIKFIFILCLIWIIYYTIRLNRTLKLSNKINKYTIKNNNNTTSLGDSLLKLYLNIKQSIIKVLEKSVYFKNKAKKFNKYSYKDYNGLSIIATKFCISIGSGILYVLYSLFENNFNFMFLILIMFLSYYAYNIILNIAYKKRTKHIEQDLLKAVVIMNNAFKSGYNITQAVDMVVKDLSGPIKEEFSKISYDLEYGLDLKDVFDRFYERAKIEDIKYITSTLSLLNLTGGNLVGVFTNIENSFTNNKRLKDELNSMTASSKLVYYCLLTMPILLTGILLLISPDYFAPLLTTPFGYLIILLIIILYISYILIIKRILRIDYE